MEGEPGDLSQMWDFKESARPAGVALCDASLDASLCDYDRDGDLDNLGLNSKYYSWNLPGNP